MQPLCQSEMILTDFICVLPLFALCRRTMGQHLDSAEHWSWVLKLAWLLVVDIDESGLSIDEISTSLPSVKDLVVFSKGGFPHCCQNLMHSVMNSFTMAAWVCEKLALYDQALLYAEAAISTDFSQAGSVAPITHWKGHTSKGRCLAFLGRPQEAEAAFESALDYIADLGLFLYEVLCLRDLKVHVLDKDGRGAEGTARLKASIHTLLGTAPAADQIAELQVAIGSAIDVADILV